MKKLACRDVGVDCDWEVSASSVEEVLRQAAIHAKAVHGYEEITEEMRKMILSKIQDVRAA